MDDSSAAALVPSGGFDTREGACRRFLSAVEDTGFSALLRRYDSGELIYHGGEPTDGLYVIKRGAMRVRASYSVGKQTRAKEATLKLLGPLGLFRTYNLFQKFLPGSSYLILCRGDERLRDTENPHGSHRAGLASRSSDSAGSDDANGLEALR